MKKYKDYCKFLLFLILLTIVQDVIAQESDADTLPVNMQRETRVKLSSNISRNDWVTPNSCNCKIRTQGESKDIVTIQPTIKNAEPVALNIIQEKVGVHKFILVYKADDKIKEGDQKDFEFDYSNQGSDDANPFGDNTELLFVSKNEEFHALNIQTEAIPYKDAKFKEIKDKYSQFTLGDTPPGQIFNQIGHNVNQRTCEACEELLSATSRLNMLFSNSSANISLVCQGISFSESDAFMKILIQNNGTEDFLTGVMNLTWMRKNGTPLKLYPGCTCPRYLPIVQPGSQIPIIYSFKAFDITDLDQLKFELHDRFGKVNVEIKIPGSDYNQERNGQ